MRQEVYHGLLTLIYMQSNTCIAKKQLETYLWKMRANFTFQTAHENALDIFFSFVFHLTFFNSPKIDQKNTIIFVIVLKTILCLILLNS